MFSGILPNRKKQTQRCCNCLRIHFAHFSVATCTRARTGRLALTDRWPNQWFFCHSSAAFWIWQGLMMRTWIAKFNASRALCMQFQYLRAELAKNVPWRGGHDEGKCKSWNLKSTMFKTSPCTLPTAKHPKSPQQRFKFLAQAEAGSTLNVLFPTSWAHRGDKKQRSTQLTGNHPRFTAICFSNKIFDPNLQNN